MAITDYKMKDKIDSTKELVIGKRVKPNTKDPIYAIVTDANSKIITFGQINANQEMVTSYDVKEYKTEKAWLKALEKEGIDPYVDEVIDNEVPNDENL